MRKLLFLILLLPLATFAQDSADAEPLEVLIIGALEIVYDAEYSFDGGALYYQIGDDEVDDLVASAHVVDETKEQPSLWLVYADGKVVVEAHDTVGDGIPDTFVNLNLEGEVESVTGAQAEALTVPETQRFVPNVPQASDGVNTGELVGDLSDISIEKKDYSWLLFIILLLAGGLFYFFFKRQK